MMLASQQNPMMMGGMPGMGGGPPGMGGMPPGGMPPGMGF